MEKYFYNDLEIKPKKGWFLINDTQMRRKAAEKLTEFRVETIQKPSPPIPTEAQIKEQIIEDIRKETLNRLLIAFSVNDQQHLMIKVQDATARAAMLTDKEARNEILSTDENIEATMLRAANQKYFAIKAAGNALEIMDPIPVDYNDDKYWP